MSNTTLMILLAFLLSACVPIPQMPAPQLLCHDGFISIPVGQSAIDPVSTDLPGHVDIVRVESHLNDPTFTAIFHLKDMPEMLDVSRTGMPFSTIEYSYTVSISVNGGPIFQRNLSDYTLAAFHQPRNMDPASGPSELMLHPMLWKNSIDKDAATIYFEEMPGYVDLKISHQANTLTMTADIPDISPNTTVLFMAEDFLSGADGSSCEPNP